jgi:hypothetical protein
MHFITFSHVGIRDETLVSNKELGEIFGLTYSSISHIKSIVLNKLKDETDTKKLFDSVKSLTKV